MRRIRHPSERDPHLHSLFIRSVLSMPKYVVRYGIMRSLGVLSPRGKDKSYRRGDRIVARTSRGLESGEVLCEATPDATDQIEDADQGEIIRHMSSNDVNELGHIQSQEGNEFLKCQEYVDKLGLEMDLVDLEHIFGGERIVIYYLAEKRVDFRELVRQLAKEFQTRIEMRQIGVRDEAKLLADYGDCGKPVCCNTHLSKMPPVSMKMAKLQKATLDPTKISGRCGRLKCCLRYEYETYEEMKKELPPVGSEIVTDTGKAEVLGHEILANQLLVKNEEGRRILIEADSVLTIIKRGTGSLKRRDNRKKPNQTDSSKSGNATGAKPESTSGDGKSEKSGNEKGGAGKSGADKSGADKSGADKSGADKSSADKSSADKSGASKNNLDKGNESKTLRESKTPADEPKADKSDNPDDTSSKDQGNQS